MADLYFFYSAGETAGLATRVLWSFTRHGIRTDGSGKEVWLWVRMVVLGGVGRVVGWLDV